MKGSTNLFCHKLLQSLWLLFIVLNSYSGLTLYLIQSSLHFVKQCAALWVINKSTIWSTDISHSSLLNIKFCKFISCVLLRYCGFLLSSLLLFNSHRSPLSECLEQAREKPTKQEILQVYVAKKLRVYRVIILKQIKWRGHNKLTPPPPGSPRREKSIGVTNFLFSHEVMLWWFFPVLFEYNL